MFHKYYAVFFSDENSESIVPVTWMNKKEDQTFTLWPEDVIQYNGDDRDVDYLAKSMVNPSDHSPELWSTYETIALKGFGRNHRL